MLFGGTHICITGRGGGSVFLQDMFSDAVLMMAVFLGASFVFVTFCKRSQVYATARHFITDVALM